MGALCFANRGSYTLDLGIKARKIGSQVDHTDLLAFIDRFLYLPPGFVFKEKWLNEKAERFLEAGLLLTGHGLGGLL